MMTNSSPAVKPPSRRPPTNSLAAYLLGRLLLRLGGWRAEGQLPDEPRLVILAAPHTSSWDGYYMLVISAVLRLRLTFMAKESLFRGPLGWLLRGFGAMPVDRSAAHGVVQQMVRAFERAPALALVIPPSGTRKRGDHWKSGFYHIARAAGVPVVCSYLDYGRKVGGIGPTIWLSGDVVRDMDQIRAAYEGVQGRYPAQTSTIRLREEGAAAADDEPVHGTDASS